MQFSKTPIAVAAFALFGALPLAAEAQSTPAPSSGSLDVWFKAPRNGSTVSGVLNAGTSCYVNGSGPIARVQFSVDGGALNTDSTPADGMQCTLDTTKLANGSHTLRADAYDSSGNRKSDVISVTVQNVVNTPPTVSMTGPSSGQTVSGTLSYSASATDNVGVTRVDFFLDGSSSALASDTAAPYAGTLDTTQLANGTHTLKAVAYDAAGLSASSQVSFNVSNNQPPTVSMTGPSAGQTVSGSVTYSANASDDNAVARVDFFLDGGGSAIASDASAPYTGTLDTTKLANGTHTLKAVAYDAQGLNASSQVSFNVSNTAASTGSTSTSTPAPVAGSLDVWFKAPAAGATVSGLLNGGTSCYTNTSGTPTRVVYTLDGAAVNTDSNPADGTQCVLDTTKFANGSHSLRADAYDASGNVKSDVVAINIQNTASTSTGGTTTTGSTGTGGTTTTGSTSTSGTSSGGTTTTTTSTPAPSAGTLDVWFKAPANGGTISGVLNGGTSCYTNSSGPVARVVYTLDTTALNTDSTPADGTQCTLDTTKFANGTHTLRAVAYDSSGNSKSDVISVNVQNAVTGSTGTSSGSTTCSTTSGTTTVALGGISTGTTSTTCSTGSTSTSTGSTGTTTGSTGSTAALPSSLLFWSDFETTTGLATPTNCYTNGCWQGVTGANVNTGFNWANVLNVGAQYQMINNAGSASPSIIGSYMQNQLQTVTGHKGSATTAMASTIFQSGCCGTGSQSPDNGSTQDPMMIQPAADVPEMYISQWMMLQPDLAQKMTGQNWREIFEWKTSDTDYRIQLQVRSDGNGGLFWYANEDGFATVPSTTFWTAFNTTLPVPVGQWFKLEVYWKRASDNTGRVWFAVNGQVVADHFGTTIGPNRSPIDRIMVNQLYSGSTYPIYQWVDDLQIWSTFPSAAQGDAWYDPPYAPH